MHIEENKPLAHFTTFGIGGPARWFVEARSEDEIVEASGWAREHGEPLFVLAGGSNLLVADSGFDGLVLRVALQGIEVLDPRLTSGAEAPVDSIRFLRGLKPTPTFASTSSGHSEAPAHLERPMYRSKPGPFNPEPNPELKALATEPAERIYRVAAGEDWDGFVQRSVEGNCAGIECLAGIPGTAGGTPVQNVGAYGQEVASTIDRVRVFNLEQRTFSELTGAECGFAYRRSRFNSTDRGRYIVTQVDYRLTRNGAPTLRYADLQEALRTGTQGGSEPTLAEVAAAVRRIRRAKGMLLVEGDPDCRSAGSFFKNPIVSEELFEQIAAASPRRPPSFSAGNDAQDANLVKLPAAWLIEQAGFAKGFSLGKAAISSRHTLALINRADARAGDVLALARLIATTVEAKFGVRLAMEPVLVGF